jgi:hypothetical protein
MVMEMRKRCVSKRAIVIVFRRDPVTPEHFLQILMAGVWGLEDDRRSAQVHVTHGSGRD